MSGAFVGAAVTVRHDMCEAEAGTVLWTTNPAAGEERIYHVQFADTTISSWPESRVTLGGTR